MSRAAASLLVLLIASCGSADRSSEWRVATDTLPNGALHVVNQPPEGGILEKPNILWQPRRHRLARPHRPRGPPGRRGIHIARA